MEEINQQNVNNIIAQNLITLRKKSGLTQLQLAEELNYSDKAISKWEKGDCVPSIYVLLQLSKFYAVPIQDIVTENSTPKPKKNKINIRLVWSFLSVAIVFFIATLSFFFLMYFKAISRPWLSFIVALPVSCLALSIRFAIWRWRIPFAILASLFVWLGFLSVCLILNSYSVWLVYIIAIPLQIIIILLTVLEYLLHRVRK